MASASSTKSQTLPRGSNLASLMMMTKTTKTSSTTTTQPQPQRQLLLLLLTTLMLMLTLTVVPTHAAAGGGVTCPPKDEDQQDPTLEEMHYYSDVVVMGKVTEHYLAPGRQRPPSSASDVYTAEMEVYCVYKGADVPAHINITDAGKPPHLCFETDFQVDMSYVAYLMKHKNGRFTPAYRQFPDSYKDEMVFICDVNITLPVGLKKLPENVKCEDKPDYDYPPYDDDYEYEGDGKDNFTCFSFQPKDGGKGQTYKTTSEDDDDSGNEPLRMSLLLLALLHVAVLVFS